MFGWLLGRYTFGSGVYAYNTVNAFNLYALRQAFWQPDGQPLVLFGQPFGSLSLWGVALVLASSLLIVGRYLQRRDDRALVEGAMLLALAFFTLATRMHERYVYGAFLLAMPLIGFGRAGLWSALVLSVTTYLNLAYSFAYQTVMEARTPGVDATNLWPLDLAPRGAGQRGALLLPRLPVSRRAGSAGRGPHRARRAGAAGRRRKAASARWSRACAPSCAAGSTRARGSRG